MGLQRHLVCIETYAYISRLHHDQLKLNDLLRW